MLTVVLIDEAIESGARQVKACEIIGISERTLQRWRKQKDGEDQRKGPNGKPKNALSDQERKRILDIVNLPENRNLSPKQIVPKLATEGIYIGSESSIYRILRHEGQLTHHQKSRPQQKRTKPRLTAYGPNEVWT
jgi:putative transposase